MLCKISVSLEDNKVITLTRLYKWLLLAAHTLLLIYALYYQMVPTHYSVDTWNEYYATDLHIPLHVTNGRFTYAIFLYLMKIFGVSNVEQASFFTVIYMLVTASLIAYLTLTVYQKVKQRCHNTITSVICFVSIFISFFVAFNNLCLTEFYLFPECMMMHALALLFAVIASRHSAKINGIRAFIVTTVLVFAAVSGYQSDIGVYVALSLLFVGLEYNNDIKQLAKSAFLAMSAGAIGAVMNPIVNKILIATGLAVDNGRGAVFKFDTIIGNIKQILRFQQEFIRNPYGFLPDNVLFVSLLVLFLVFLIVRYKSLDHIAIVTIFALGGYTAVFLPMVLTPIFWPGPRTMTGFWFFVAEFIVLILFSVLSAQSALTKKILYFPLIISIVMLSLNIPVIYNLQQSHLQSNKNDIEQATAIGNAIKQYEILNKKKVNYISFAYDQYLTYRQPNVTTYTYDVNVSAFACDWSDHYIVNKVNDLQLQKVDMPDNIYNKYFEGKNWNEFNLDEQMIILDDIAYICIY